MKEDSASERLYLSLSGDWWTKWISAQFSFGLGLTLTPGERSLKSLCWVKTFDAANQGVNLRVAVAINLP